jgi:TolB-like protein/Tfp pilus assembly protein PilF
MQNFWTFCTFWANGKSTSCVFSAPPVASEQARGDEPDLRADVFSLGVVLYEMATGRRPFEGDTTAAVSYAILTHTPRSPLDLRQDLPNQLGRVINKALEKNRNSRYQTAHELLVDLNNLRREGNSGMQARAQPTRRVVWMTLAGSAAAATGATLFWWSASPTSVRSIAVLPFVNSSGDPNLDYLSDGITEAVTNALSQLSDLRVTARTTAFRFKGRDTDATKVGRELGVRTTVTGRVDLRDGILSVQAELIDVASGSQLWGERYQIKFSELVSTQGTIASEISKRLRIRITEADHKRLVRGNAINAEAYEFYLRGRYFWNKGTVDSFKRATELFARAIEIDSSHAPAHVGLSRAWIMLGHLAYVSPQDSFLKAKGSVVKALELDERLAEAHTALGDIECLYDWNWAEAKRQYKRAIELNGRSAEAQIQYSFLLQIGGQHDLAIATAKDAQALDPLSAFNRVALASIYYFARRYQQALDAGQEALNLEPNYSLGLLFAGLAYEQRKDYASALANIEKFITTIGDQATGGLLGHAYALSGRRQEAIRTLKRVLNVAYVSPVSVAMIYTGLGDHAEAMGWLERGFRGRDHDMAFIRLWPQFDPLQSQPRFQHLVRAMHFPE